MKNKLTKASRYALIASLCGVGAAVVHASASEVSEEITLATARQDSGKLEIDSDLPELPSALSFRNANEFGTGTHDETTLTLGERKQLAKEVAEYRAAQSKKFAIVPACFWGNCQA